LFGADEVARSVAHRFFDDREPSNFSSSGFFPLINSDGPGFFIEDGSEYSLLKSIFKLLDQSHFGSGDI
jgi:hypothetical protein